MRISSPAFTEILTGRGSDIRRRLELGVADPAGRARPCGVGRGRDRKGGENERADQSGGDAGDAVFAEHVRPPVSLVCVSVPPSIGVTGFVKQGACQIVKSAEIRQKPAFSWACQPLKSCQLVVKCANNRQWNGTPSSSVNRP